MTRETKAASPLWRRINAFARVLEYVGALLLFAMMALTFVDVVGRYVLGKSVVGAFEVTEFMLATLIYIGIPLITLRGGHIAVDLFEHLLSSGFRQIRDRFVNVLWAVVLGYLGYQLWIKSADLVDVGEITQVLRLPVAPVAYLMGALVFLAAALAVAMVVIGAPDDALDEPSDDASVAAKGRKLGKADLS